MRTFVTEEENVLVRRRCNLTPRGLVSSVAQAISKVVVNFYISSNKLDVSRVCG